MAGMGDGYGWVLKPPVTRSEAEEVFGATIPEPAWKEICQAFERHGFRLDDLNGTKANNNRNDTKGWARRQKDTQRVLKSAFEGLGKIDRGFLDEAEDLYSLSRSGGLEIYNASEKLDRVHDEILFLLTMIERAEPMDREIPTEAESRKILARDVYKALLDCGASLSNGWSVNHDHNPTEADLTGFERLAALLKIHTAHSPAARSKWLREVMVQKG
jgi:hypothetical protein